MSCLQRGGLLPGRLKSVVDRRAFLLVSWKLELPATCSSAVHESKAHMNVYVIIMRHRLFWLLVSERKTSVHEE